MLRQFSRLYSTKVLPKSSDVVVIGGGVIGLSTAYHLNQLGYNNVIVVERDEITSGTTWHTNGLVWRLRPSETDIQLLSRTHELVSKVLCEGEGDRGWINNGGLFLAHNQKRMQEYQRLNGISKYYGIKSYILDRYQTIDILKPLIDERTSDLVGGLFSPNDGFVDPNWYCSALIKEANLQVFSKCRLNAIKTSECFGVNVKQKKINSICVQLDEDIHEIKTNIVVNCSGVWAPIVAKLAGIEAIPQEAMEHSFVITQPIDGVNPEKTPNIRDHDLSIVFRVSGNSFCIGGYEPNPVLITHKVHTLEPFTLFDLNWDKFGIHLENSAKLMPIINKTGIKDTICGPESFTPDHKPLLGEDMNVGGFFHCSAFNSFGISLSGGIGQQMAKWIVSGAPDIDLSAYDIKRFNKHLINNKVWCEDRCRESYARNYGIIYQLDEPIAARNQTLKDPLYETLLDRGCVYRERHGIQSPDWFDLEDNRLTTEQYIDLDNTYDWPENSRQWKAIKYECESCHERAVVFNLSSMSKFSLRGQNALQVIDSLSPTHLKSMSNNSTLITYLLDIRGGLNAEIVLNKVNENEFYITCGDLATNHVFFRINNYIIDNNIKNTEIIDLSKEMSILSINGPKSTEVLQKCLNISLKNFEDRTHKELEIGDIKIRLIRLTQVSQIGWELHCNHKQLKTIYLKLMNEELVSNGGYRAYEYLKNENQWLSGCLDLKPDYMLSDVGLEGHICEHKLKNNAFIGCEAMKSRGKEKQMVWIRFQTKSQIVCGLEPLWSESQTIGFVKKQFYCHKSRQMLSFGVIWDKYLKDSKLPSSVDIEIFGKLYKAKIEKIVFKQNNIQNIDNKLN